MPVSGELPTVKASLSFSSSSDCSLQPCHCWLIGWCSAVFVAMVVAVVVAVVVDAIVYFVCHSSLQCFVPESGETKEESQVRNPLDASA